eukprot:4945253-Alexandrium_andersonii.AAC.1
MIAERLIDQHTLHGAADMRSACIMACHAKNTLTRRAGASPAQWAFGRQPNLPGALLSDPEGVEAQAELCRDDHRGRALRRPERLR